MMDKQKILDKVTKLMSLANSPGANTNEAATALRQARSLMAKYNIESDELRASQVLETSVPTGTRRSPADWLHSLAATCAAANSTRSRASVVMICRGSTPYRPLKAMSSVFSGRPRMVNTWEKLPKPADWRTDASLSSTSPTVRACWSAMVLAV